MNVQPDKVAEVDLVYPMPEPKLAEEPGVPAGDVHVIMIEDPHHPAEVTNREPGREVSALGQKFEWTKV